MYEATGILSAIEQGDPQARARFRNLAQANHQIFRRRFLIALLNSMPERRRNSEAKRVHAPASFIVFQHR
jgi:hypothetical protein